MKTRKLLTTLPTLILTLLASTNALALHCTELFKNGGGILRVYPDAVPVSSADLASMLSELTDITQPLPHEFTEQKGLVSSVTEPSESGFLAFDHRGAPVTRIPEHHEIEGFRNGTENSAKETNLVPTGPRKFGLSNDVHQLIFGDPQQNMMILKLRTDEELAGFADLGTVHLLASLQTERPIGFGKDEMHTITLYLLSKDGYSHKVFRLPPGSSRPKTARFLANSSNGLFLWADNTILKLKIVSN